jgi:hypothetical protein
VSHCPTCAADVIPSQEILPGGVIVTACPRCEFPFEKREKAAKAKPAAAAPQPVRVVSTATPDNLVDQVRSRLATIEVELERFSSLKREHATLQRMLRAAERKR